MARTLAAALTLALAAPAFAHDYEMKDLEALEKQESWQEAAQHLGDIPPSKRNDNWQRIAERACAGLLAQSEGHATLRLADDLLKRYPTLKKGKTFMAARADHGLKAFGKTYSDSRRSAGDNPWLEQLKGFVDADGVTPDLALRAVRLVNGRLVAYVAIPLVQKAVAQNAGVACKDPDVKKSIAAAVAENVWAEEAKKLSATCK